MTNAMFTALTTTRLGLTGEYDDPRTEALKHMAWLQQFRDDEYPCPISVVSLSGERYVVKAVGVATQAFVPIGDVKNLIREEH